MKKLMSLLVVFALLIFLNINPVQATMISHNSTISFSAGHKGYSSSFNKTESATKHSTRLNSVTFNSMPSGHFPTPSTTIYFTPCLSSNKEPIGYRNAHTATDMANGTIKHDEYYAGNTGTVNNVVWRSYSSYTSNGATVGVSWNFGYVTSF